MDIQPTAVDPGALMTRIAELISLGRPGAARPLLAAVRGLAPPSAGLSVLAARLALMGGGQDDAEAELDAALLSEPQHAGLRKCRAELRRQRGDLEGAARDAAEAVICDRDDAGGKALLGMLMLDMDRPDDAIACLGEAVAAAPMDVTAWESLARAHAAAGTPETALEVLQVGIAAVPGAVALRNAAILLCIRLRDFTRADQLAENGRLDGVADACTFGLRGHALSSMDRHDEAAAAYGEALKLGPDDPYVRHLAASARLAAPAEGAPGAYVRTLFDGYADRFESHLISLGYRIPGLIRHQVLDFTRTAAVDSVLDLGCGTGLVAVALSDLNLGPITGLDLSVRMLDQARDKGLYTSLRHAELPAALWKETQRWPLILAADLMCYFGALEDVFTAVRDRMTPGGRFIFSVEELLPDRDGILHGGGGWLLGRQGRYAHTKEYVVRAGTESGLKLLSVERETLRHEAGDPVAGILVAAELA